MRKAETFNEIMLDRCLHPDPLWSTLADKLAVRDYVKSKVGEKHLVPLIAVPDEFTHPLRVPFTLPHRTNLRTTYTRRHLSSSLMSIT